MLFVPMSFLATEDDDYLSAISAEAEKVEQMVSGDKNGAGHYLHEFAQELETRFRGSYAFKQFAKEES